ncbi:type IV pilin protein [Nevskia sp.]|uniref:type IV pilin protein n=1 Tax=Nevskia sp. TaxID=1929292 RepID=UPI0025EF1727|nr:type IV pilin protein [Nevskia sp.]
MTYALQYRTSRPSRPSSQAGFSLLELMIALVVVGILAAIALPSYRSYVLRSNRALVRAILVDIAAKLEAEALASRGIYPTNFDFYLAGGTPPILDKTEIDLDREGHITANAMAASTYRISLTPLETAAVPRRYRLTATAVNNQAQDQACATLVVESNGLRTATPGNNAVCWSR